MNDYISKQAAIDFVDSETVSTNPEHFKSSEKFIEFMDDADIASFGKWQWANGFNTALVATTIQLKKLPSADVVEVVRCQNCIYYDEEHIEKDGVRYEYKDMPDDAFDKLGTGLVNVSYGINVGGRCCKDYNIGYAEDKRVFRCKTDFCSRAERRIDG